MMKSLRRTREFATRIALGSSLKGLLRQLLTESAVLTLAGGALGLLFAEGAILYFNHAQPIELPVGASVSLNFPALVFTASISAIAVLFLLRASQRGWRQKRMSTLGCDTTARF